MKDNKYEIILAAGATLIRQKGYQGCSLQEIADTVGLHKSTLFHYFKHKEELLLRILERSIEDVNTSLENIIRDDGLKPEKKLKKAIDSHLTLLQRYFDNVSIYLNEVRSLSKKNQAFYMKKRKKYEKDFETIVQEMKIKGYFNGLNTKIVTFGLLGMLNWVAKWYQDDGPLTIDEISNVFYRMIVNP